MLIFEPSSKESCIDVFEKAEELLQEVMKKGNIRILTSKGLRSITLEPCTLVGKAPGPCYCVQSTDSLIKAVLNTEHDLKLYLIGVISWMEKKTC